MLGSSWEVGTYGVRIYWPFVTMVHNILTLASNTLGLSAMMSTTQPIPGQKLMTGQAVLSWLDLLTGGCLNLSVVLSCQTNQLCIREILQGQVVDRKAGVWGGGDHGGGGDACLRQVDGVVRVG